MVGFPNACSYSDWAGISYPMMSDVEYATTGDQFAWTCGYYVFYEWSGAESVYFEISSMNAIASAFSAFTAVAISALLF